MIPNVKCAPLAQVIDNYNAIQTLIIISATVTFLAGAAALLFASTASAPPLVISAAGVVIAGCIAAIATITRFRNYEFNNKLACIDGLRCAMGQVISLENCGDGDQALNLLLAPVFDPNLAPGWADLDPSNAPLQNRLLQNIDTPDEYQTYIQPAELIYDPDNLQSRGWNNVPLAGGTVPPSVNWLPLLHCEIVGSFINDWTLALIAWLTAVILAALALIAAESAIAGAAIAVAAGAVSLGLALVVLVILLVILFAFEGGGNAPAEVLGGAQGTVPSQQVPGPDGTIDTDPTGFAILTSDFVMVAGLHVFDTGHHLETAHFTDQNGDQVVPHPCWHELHPVIGITKVEAKIYAAAPAKEGSPKYFEPWCQALVLRAQGLAEAEQAVSPLEHAVIG